MEESLREASESSVIKLNFKGFSRPSIYSFFFVGYMQFRSRTRIFRRELLKSCECHTAKSPWFIVFITRRPFFHNFFFGKSSREWGLVLRAAPEPASLVAGVTIILESIAFWRGIKDIKMNAFGADMCMQTLPLTTWWNFSHGTRSCKVFGYINFTPPIAQPLSDNIVFQLTK